jgi:hypothetical protein
MRAGGDAPSAFKCRLSSPRRPALFLSPVSHFLPVTLPHTTAMAHNDGSGSDGFVHPANFTEVEARIL